MTSTRIEYLISEMMGPPELLVIEKNGEARFESHSNIADAGTQSVGTFAMALTPDRMKALTDAFAHPPFRELPDHWGQIASGERYRAIRDVGPSEQIEKRVGTTRLVSPPTQAMFDRMDQIVKDVRLHPLGNLTLRIGEATVDSDGTLRASMTLANPGTVTFFCIDPARAPRLSLSAWPDRDKATIRSTDIINVKSIEVSPVDSARKGSGDLLELPPGATVSFHIKAVLPLPEKAPFVIRGRYQNTDATRGGRDLMVIELYSKTERLERFNK